MTSDDLSKIRDEQTKLMSETVYVQRLTKTPDGAGGWSEAWNTQTTTVGRIVARTGKDNLQGGQPMDKVEFVVTIPYNVTVLETDRLQINGEQYEIIAILDRSQKTAQRIVCNKL